MKLIITTLTMIFINFGASAEKLPEDHCGKIYDNVLLGIIFINKHDDKLDEDYRAAINSYRKQIVEWSTIYQVFCKDKD